MLLPLFVVGAVSEQPAPDQPASLPALQVVVLVDESGSLSETDVVREKEAARTIVFSVLAPGSVVSVAGFGSSEREGQSAVDVVCPKTTLDSAQKRDSLATCVDGLHRRSDAEGDDTDHVAALQQALDVVRSPGPEKKLVFLLTDGVLDVRQSPAWGDTPERRQAAATAKAKDVLGELDRAGAQVWPFGFGAVDNAALRDFAKGKSCTTAATDPREQIAATSAELTRAVAEAFSSASCVKYGPVDTGTVPTGGSADLTVDIPAIASDASIVVYKRDKRVQVEYRPPNSDEPVPAGDPKFEFAGQSTETESLRITDPEPGRWTIRLSSAEVPTQDVAANVVYQAAVKANVIVSPQPVAGQPVNVEMQVWARGRAITDQQALRDLSFAATLTGSSGFPAQRVLLTDPENDGTFSGQVNVPEDASGNLTVTGEVTGLGIGGDTRQWFATVQSAPAEIQAQILFDANRAAVTPGGTVAGTVKVDNDSGQPANLRLALVDPTPGTTLTVDPDTVRADVGSSTTPFTLKFDADTPVGAHAATLRLTDEAKPEAVVAERLFATEVAPEPGLLEKLLWLWVTLAVVLLVALGFALLKVRARLSARTVRGLRAQLLRSGVVTFELAPRDPNDTVFGFVIHEDITGPQLQHASRGEPNLYQARRAGGGISLAIPGQQPVLLAPGERRALGQSLAVIILDEREAATATPIPTTGTSYNPFDGYESPEPLATSPAAGNGGPGGHHYQGDPFNDTSAGDSYRDPNNPFL